MGNIAHSTSFAGPHGGAPVGTLVGGRGAERGVTSTDGANAQGLLSFDNEHGEREPRTGEHAQHAFCSLRGGCAGRTPPSSASLPLGVFRSPHTGLRPGKRAQVVQSRARHHARTTTRTRKDKPTRNVTFKGKEKKQSRRKPRKMKGGERPFVFHQLVAFGPPESDFLSWSSFFSLFFFCKEFQYNSYVVRVFNSI